MQAQEFNTLGENASGRGGMGDARLNQMILAIPFGNVLLVVDIVPMVNSPGLSMRAPETEPGHSRLGLASVSTYHLSTKCRTKLFTIGPDRLMLISDQPILELLVRSTAPQSDYQVGDAGISGTLTRVVLPFLDILKVVQPGVVVVLAFEDGLIDTVGVDVSNGMAVGVPPPKAFAFILG